MVVVSSCREMLGSVPQRAQPLSSVTSIKLGTLERLPVINRRQVGMTSHHHATYGLVYTRTTMGVTERSKSARRSKSDKSIPSSDCRLQLAYMKLVLLVIANQHVAVNAFPGLVHPARHTMRVGKTQST